MGVEPPFIYDKPSSYTFGGPTSRGFDPKAATRASWSPPAPKPKKDGPLIDFNRHPDSYLIVPYGNLNVEPMNPKTKVRVQRTRTLQLLLRILELLGALGLLFCVISINKTSTAVGWIIRVGPAVALCHCVYAVYHLCRNAASRPAASSASYMLFAAMIDTGLIPFFAFSAIMANTEYSTNEYEWSTLFGDDTITYKIIYAFFLTCVSEGGLMVASLIIDLYLAIVFRKIAKMPPDMNPLEDNLTARPNKHKRNKSEMVFEKHLSGSTLASERMSYMNGSQSNFKRVPFMHTRTDSADSITLYGNEKPLNSTASLRNGFNEDAAATYLQSSDSRRNSLSPTRPLSAIVPAANARAPGAGLGHKPVRSSGLAQNNGNSPAVWLSYSNQHGVPTSLSDTAHQQLDHDLRALSPVSALSEHDVPANRAHSERQNWFQGSPQNSPPRNQTYMPFAHPNISRDSLDQKDTTQQGMLTPPTQPKKRSRDPLGMNPPTPAQRQYQDGNVQYSPDQRFYTPQRPALNDMPVNSTGRPGMGSRPSSFVGSGGKSRYYGNLRNSLGGSPTRESFESPMRTVQDDDRASIYSGKPEFAHVENESENESENENFKVYGSEDDSDLEDHEQQLRGNEKEYADLGQQVHDIMLGVPRSQDTWNGTRKVSNSTGYDLKTGYAGLGNEFGQGMARRREVSGKVAEEGRGGTGYGQIGFSEVRDGAVVTGQGQRGGAAGWAKFHGR